eukprot:8936996-Ditylum_brightwellii.AAC.1
MEEHVQKVITTQLETFIPAIVKATVNHLMLNKFINKTINTTIGTTVNKITGDDSIKETNDNKVSGKSTEPVVTLTPETESNPAEDSEKTVSKETLLQQRISARTRA